MTRYRRVEVGTWRDSRFRSFSSPTPNAKTLWLYLLSGPRTTSFPGLVVATEAVIADDLGWPVTRTSDPSEGGCRCLRDAWQEIESQGMGVADWSTGVVILLKSLLDSGGSPRDTATPTSPNVLCGWGKIWRDVPDCRLKDEYLLRLKVFAEALGEPYVKAFEKGFSTPLAGLRSTLREPARSLSLSPPVSGSSSSSLSGASGQGPRDLVPGPPDEAAFRDRPLQRGGARDAGFTVPPAPSARDRAASDVPKRPIPGAIQGDPELQKRQALVARFLERVNALRRGIAERHGLRGVGPIPLHGGERETELRQRIAEAGTDAERQLDHALEVAEAEANAAKSVEWLGWSIGRSWTLLLQKTVDGVRKGAKAKTSSAFDDLDEAHAEAAARGKL